MELQTKIGLCILVWCLTAAFLSSVPDKDKGEHAVWFWSTIITIGASIIGLCFTIIGFFLKRLLSDLKDVIQETGKNKGKIELVQQQQMNDTKRMEAMTQLELKVLSENVSELTKNVNILVISLAKKGIET